MGFKRLRAAVFCFALTCLSNIALAQLPTPSYMGVWFKASEPGWGVSVQQQGARIFAVWYTFGADRIPVWHTLSCELVGTRCSGDLYTATGTPLTQMIGSANPVVVRSGSPANGAATLDFSIPQRLTLAYTVGNVQQTKTDLEPLIFGRNADVPVCSLQAGSTSNLSDLWWGGESRSGWGMHISQQGNRVFLAWYAYNPAGGATWFTGIGDLRVNALGMEVSGELYEIALGTAFSNTFARTQPPTQSVGTFSINFSSSDAGTLMFSLPRQGVVARQIPLVRFRSGVSTPAICTADTRAATPLPVGDITPAGTAAPCSATSGMTTLAYVNDNLPGHKLDLYRPVGAGPFPLVIWIHGGGWITGDKADVVPAARRLLCEGYALASVNYRLSGTAKFPAQIHDVKAAIRYLRANAAALNIDPVRFATFGSSAGGHLASLASTSVGSGDLEDLSLGNPTSSSAVQSAIAWFGPSDFAQMDGQTIAQGCGVSAATHGARDSPESNLVGCTVADASCIGAVTAANPARYITRSTAPLLLMHGTRDCTVPNAQSTVMQQAMQAASRCVSRRDVLGAGHGGAPWDTAAVQDAVSQFLRATLGPSAFVCKAE